MASKTDRFYYENFTSAAQYCCDAAAYLQDCLTHYDRSNINEMLEKMHQFEHGADDVRHDMSRALAKAFVTPIDREDLAQISSHIDEVTDSIEEVLQRFYMYEIESVVPEAIEFAAKIVEICGLMKETLEELPNFKKPQKLHQMIMDVNHIEEECDKLFVRAIMNIPKETSDVLTIVSWREIIDRLEMCSDACEHVCDCIETIVMKNS